MRKRSEAVRLRGVFNVMRATLSSAGQEKKGVRIALRPFGKVRSRREINGKSIEKMADGKRRLYTKKREQSRETARGAAKSAHTDRAEYTARYVVPRSDTLLVFLLKKSGQSRNNVKTLLSKGKVSVNGMVERQFDFPLAKDDEVKISKNSVAAARKTTAGEREKGGVTAKRGADKARAENHFPVPKILYEDENFLAVEKPAGLLSVESDKETLSAYRLISEYLKRKGGKERAYILHRIDKATSGVLVFAKNIKVHSMMRMNWNDLVKKREYYAVIAGKTAEKEGKIVCYLKEDENRLMRVVSPEEGKRAVTRFETLKANATYSLLRVEIDSGRKNQIRAAMKSVGCPIVGDEKYGFVDSPLRRLGLHASELRFVHPQTGKEYSFVSPAPAEFFKLF